MQSKISAITTGAGGKIYQSLLDGITKYTEPHDFVGAAYGLYLQNYPNNPSINGRIFEFLICETLAQADITPFYYQARFERVPNADFDVVMYNEITPIALTMKVSLRERYKQADLESLALQQVYRQAQSHLITLSESEAAGVVAKIKAGDIVGLDTCILANRPEYTELLAELSKQTFSKARAVMPITGITFPVSDLD